MTEKASFPAAIGWATVLILCHVVKSLKLIFFSETHLNIDEIYQCQIFNWVAKFCLKEVSVNRVTQPGTAAFSYYSAVLL